jgi:hypothetical protein
MFFNTAPTKCERVLIGLIGGRTFDSDGDPVAALRNFEKQPSAMMVNGA